MPYQFSAPRAVSQNDFARLTPLQRDQLLVAGREALGNRGRRTDVQSLRDVFALSARRKGTWEHFRVSGDHNLDAWIFNRESGTLFLADSKTTFEILLLDGSFQPEVEATPALTAQCQALGAAFQEALATPAAPPAEAPAAPAETSSAPEAPAAPAPANTPEG